ncbi:MAG: amidohydrolase family protein, partial [Acidobacteriota bacterium]
MIRMILPATFVFLQAAGVFAQANSTTVISSGTLIDGTGTSPVSNAIVIIEGDRIAKAGPAVSIGVPQGARPIDAKGKFILPGLIDTHVHLESVGLSDIGELPTEWSTPNKLQELVVINARLNLIAGFTTVRDLGSTELVLQVRDDINSGELLGPRIVAAGMQLVKKSAAAHSEPVFLQYDGVDGARAKVRYLADLGVNVIKIRLTHMRQTPSFEEVRAIVEEAHRLGLRTTVHTDVPADDRVKLA